MPVVVLEIVLGILIGPELLSLAEPDEFIEFFSSLGLGMLFFFCRVRDRLRPAQAPPTQARRTGAG